jgi:predicted HTH domain antitoxin
MSIKLEIPDSVTQALRLPPAEQQKRLSVELALSLYAQGILSFGKARELAGLDKRDFGLLLGRRQIARHYDPDDLKEDIAYVRGE